MEKRSSSESFTGQKAIRTAYEILLSNAQENNILRYLYPYDDYHEIATPFYSRFYKFQKSKKIIERGISTLNSRDQSILKKFQKM